MDISLPLMKADNFTVTNHYCIMKGSSRHSNITIGWPTDSPCYSLAILFSAVRVKVLCCLCIHSLLVYRISPRVVRGGT